MFSNQSNYILPLCNTYILFCSELKDTICSCDKQKYYQPMGERQSAKLEKRQTLLYYKEAEVSMFLRSLFYVPYIQKKNWKKFYGLISWFWKGFLVHEVCSVFISSLVSWRIKYLHNSNISFKQERLFLLWRR